MLNPITIIKEDHRKVEELFAKYRALGENALEQKGEISKEIIKELAIHARMEEKYFYPRLKEALKEDHPADVEEAIAEHHAMKVLLLELKVMSTDSPQYDAKMTVLEENVMHHVEEEENELLPEAEESLDETEKEKIGKEMMEYKESAHRSLIEKLLGE